MLTVREVYDKIAPHFDVSRQRIWNSVKLFINSLKDDAKVLDLGCGNGKNMLYRRSLNIKGIDISDEQVKICKRKNLDVEQGTITSLNQKDNEFDNMLCIATYHHLDNDEDRRQTLTEIHRCLKPGGTILITVWAIEQHEGSTFSFTKADELVPWTTTEGNTFYRYYHIYKKGELENEIARLCPDLQIQQVDWELGNWSIILMKKSY